MVFGNFSPLKHQISRIEKLVFFVIIYVNLKKMGRNLIMKYVKIPTDLEFKTELISIIKPWKFQSL